MSDPSTSARSALFRRIGLALGVALFAALHWGWGGPPGQPQVGAMAAVAALMSVWWMTEAAPLAVTAMLPLVLFPLLGLGGAREVPGHYFNDIIVLFLGAFLIALAMERWNLHRRIALGLISSVGSTPATIVLAFLLAAALLSMWISNTATSLMMLPIGLAIVSQLDERFGEARARPLSLGLMLAIAYGCSIGGVSTPVGTPTNLAFLKIYADTFPNAPAISFGQWILFAAPISLLMGVAAWLVITRVFCRCDAGLKLDRKVVRTQLRALGPMTREEKSVAVFFAVAAVLWVFRKDLDLGFFVIPGWARLAKVLAGVDDGTVAVLLAVLLFLFPASPGNGRLLDAATFARVPWDILLLFGGGFALAAGFVTSGLSQYLAGLFSALGEAPVWAALLAVCLLLTFLTELTSNVATAQMLLPVLAAWAVAERIHPLLFMVPATISASMAFMLPVATPPNAVVFSSRRVRIAEMARVGVVLNLTGVAVIALLSRWLVPLFLRFDAAVFPDWAQP